MQRCLGNAVAGDENAAGAKDVDAVAVLARAAGCVADFRNPIAGDDSAVFLGV